MNTQLVFRADAYARSCDATVIAAGPTGIVLDRTVFYPTGGGQPGDSGQLRRADGAAFVVVDTVKGEGGMVLHVLADGAELPQVGDAVEAEIDWARRYRHMRFHTALHLLCAVVTAPVTGGQVASDKARLDFDIDMSALQKDAIESQLNDLIEAGHPVSAGTITDAELAAQPELVKTMSVAPPTGTGSVRVIAIPGVDLQPCGGTHVANTREIGPIEVVKIRSEGKRNKRVIIAFAGEGIVG